MRFAKHAIFILLLASIVFISFGTDTGPPIELSNFSGGVNLAISDLNLPEKQAQMLYNMEIYNNFDLRPRPGYVSVTDTVDNNNDAIVGIYGLAKRNGQQKLIEIVNDSTEDWANLNVGNLSSVSEVAQYFYRSAQFDFTTWRNYAIICDGYNFPYMTDGDSANRSMHVPAPGEVMVEILDTDTSRSTLNGTYRWALIVWPNCDTTSDPCNLGGFAGEKCWTGKVSYITQSLTVYKKQVALHLFIDMVKDSACESPLPLKFRVARTRVNETDLETPDSSFIECLFVGCPSADQLWIMDDSITILDANLLTTTVVDSGTDSTAGYGHITDSFHIYYEKTFDLGSWGRATTFDSIRHYGTPLFYSATPSVDTTTYTARDRYGGGMVRYAVTFYDTVLDIESDTCMNAKIFVFNQDSLITIALPSIPASLDYCVMKLYRGIRSEFIVSEEEIIINPPLRLITQFNDPPTTYLDTFSVATLDTFPSLHPEYEIPGTHYRFDGLIIWDDRLYGWGDDGGPNRLYYSIKDTALFNTLDFITLGPDDGDKIVKVSADRNRLLPYKNESRHEVYEDANGEFSRTSPPYMVGGEGCIAAQSMVTWRGSRIYLGPYGVVLETGSQFLDQGNTVDTISLGIKKILDGWSENDKSKAVGRIIKNNQYFLSFYEKDTTLVCFLDFQGNPWAVYGTSFRDGTYYEDDSDFEITVPDDFIFCRDSSDQVFHWDSTGKDNGTGFVKIYWSGLIEKRPFALTYPYRFLGIMDGDETNGSAYITFYDVDRDSIPYKKTFSDFSSRYNYSLLGVDEPQDAYSIKFVCDTLLDSLIIEAFIIYEKYVKQPDYK